MKNTIISSLSYDAPPNNSFNASGNSSDVVVNLDAWFVVCRRVNSGVRLLIEYLGGKHENLFVCIMRNYLCSFVQC
jgi:hypothetical protein